MSTPNRPGDAAAPAKARDTYEPWASLTRIVLMLLVMGALFVGVL